MYHDLNEFVALLEHRGQLKRVKVPVSAALEITEVTDRVHVNDLQATLLRQLGLDHLKLTYRFQGRDFRLTDVGGNIVERLVG